MFDLMTHSTHFYLQFRVVEVFNEAISHANGHMPSSRYSNEVS